MTNLRDNLLVMILIELRKCKQNFGVTQKKLYVKSLKEEQKHGMHPPSRKKKMKCLLAYRLEEPIVKFG